MATSPTPQVTDFSRDVLGRFVCNGLDEAQRSADKSTRPDARPFDIIVIGGGTFGSAIAQDLFFRDEARRHRILVLEGGPLLLPEHIQNLPLPGLNVAGATSIADLRAIGQDRIPREEVWGLAWHSSAKFPGLAYCLGGRSLYWGGWSPRLLDAEMPANRWPSGVVTDLKGLFFDDASRQIGVNETNDFISGPLHEALRQRLFEGINAGKVAHAIPLAQLPLHLDNVPVGQEGLHKLEAPLAVQSQTLPGLFPFNKFSAVPLLMKAARAAVLESNNDDVKKRLMVLPYCHVIRLTTAGDRVVSVETNQGGIPVPPGGVVIIALGTIESTRLAQLSFEGFPNSNLIGSNLMAHLRSNLDVRFPREALAIDPTIKALHASALFVKGQHQHADGSVGHFHLQITAAGLEKPGGNSEAELFKKVPDIDSFEVLRNADDKFIVLTLRGIGEMEPQNPGNHVRLDPETDEFGARRAFVSIAPTAKDLALWDAMDKAADDVAKVFAGNQPEVLRKVRDGLGTTHHETGTLWMGDDPNTSVTNADGRFHHVANAYVAGPALFPTIGSPNPMLTGIAMGRRLARHLIPDPMPYVPPEAGFMALFDGFTTRNWRMAGRGNFIIVDGTLESVPGDDLGLYWCTAATPRNFILKLEWLRWRHDDNSGVFVRFPHPDSKGYNNTAYVGVHFGFEVQIDELGRPDGADAHSTGAIYNEPSQTLTLKRALPAGEWNDFEIRVQDQRYTVWLNGEQVSTFQNPHTSRGLPSAPNAPSFIGLQAYPGSRVAFRNIRIKKL